MNMLCTYNNFTTQNFTNSFSIRSTHSKVPVDGFIPNVTGMAPQSRDPEHATPYHRR